jgi:hypothetical protein
MAPNLHDVAQKIVPAARVVYVDNDPMVLAHGRALLRDGPPGTTVCVDGDLRDPEAILADGRLQKVLDLRRPVALSLLGVLHVIGDADDPYGLVGRLVSALPAGSCVAVSHLTGDFAADQVGDAVTVLGKHGVPLWPRGRVAVERFFTGLDVVEPGVVPAHRWRPDVFDVGRRPRWELPRRGAAVSCYAGVAKIGKGDCR